MQFSALFSYMLWHIELKFCIWLCFTILQIKFDCRQFAFMFLGVMPLLELRILKIHSFPHFSLSCFDILSWNFAYDFVSAYYRSSLSVITLRQFLKELCLFVNLEYRKCAVFRTFLLHSLTYWAEILHMTFFYRTIDQVSVSSNFVGLMPLFIRPSSDGTYYGMVMSVRVSVRPTLRPVSFHPGLRPPVFRTFLLHALTYRADILHMTLF